MKTITVDLIKKNRKYFAAKLNGYPCKILIDSNSKDLELGEQTLLVDDISVRSKYGTDLIYKLACEQPKVSQGICTLKHRYNSKLVEKCRELGGRFDRSEEVWVFSTIVEDKVEELDYIYNSDELTLEIKAIKGIAECTEPVEFLGYTIAKAFGRDSGAKLGEHVSMLEGKISSGGSMKNWDTCITEGSVFRLQVPSELYKTYEEDGRWEIKILG